MPPVQSKPVASHGNSTDLESLYGSHDINDDQHVCLDPNLASIISNAVAKIKSKQLKKPPPPSQRKESVNTHVLYVKKC